MKEQTFDVICPTCKAEPGRACSPRGFGWDEQIPHETRIYNQVLFEGAGKDQSRIIAQVKEKVESPIIQPPPPQVTGVSASAPSFSKVANELFDPDADYLKFIGEDEDEDFEPTPLAANFRRGGRLATRRYEIKTLHGQVLPLGQTDIDGALPPYTQPAHLEASPQRPFKARHLLIEAPPGVMVETLRSGNVDALGVSYGQISAAMYAPPRDMADMPMELRMKWLAICLKLTRVDFVCEVGSRVSLQLRNTTPDKVRVNAHLVGSVSDRIWSGY